MDAEADDEEEDDGRATPIAGLAGFHSATSANETGSQPGRLRPSDSLAAHRQRLGHVDRQARCRSGERKHRPPAELPSGSSSDEEAMRAKKQKAEKAEKALPQLPEVSPSLSGLALPSGPSWVGSPAWAKDRLSGDCRPVKLCSAQPRAACPGTCRATRLWLYAVVTACFHRVSPAVCLQIAPPALPGPRPPPSPGPAPWHRSFGLRPQR
jgi:hypothetical protein